MSVSEACTNAIHHGYKDNNSAKVVISATIHTDRLEITVKKLAPEFAPIQ